MSDGVFSLSPLPLFAGSATEEIELTGAGGGFPSHPNLSSKPCHPTKEALVKAATIDSPESAGLHYSSLQCLHCSHPTHLMTTTDSGNICINDSTAVSKLLSKLGPMSYCDDPSYQPNRHIVNFDGSIKISFEWNAQQQLILRHISGDASRYRNLCHSLISTII